MILSGRHSFIRLIFSLLFSALLLLIIFSHFTTVVRADNYTLLAPLPCIGEENKCDQSLKETNLPLYLPGIFKFGIGIAVVMAFVMITFGGIQFMTSDAIMTKSEGRKKIENAIWGLLLVIGAWLILNTINPNILTFKLELIKPDVPEDTIIGVDKVKTKIDNGLILVDGGPCNDCVGVNQNGLTLTESGKSNVIGFITGQLSSKLGQLNNNLNGSVEWHITEAYPPTVTHSDPCHGNGTCVDANISNPTATNINSFLNAAKKSGLNATYEVKTQPEKTRLVNQGVPELSIMVNTQATAPHFHVK